MTLRKWFILMVAFVTASSIVNKFLLPKLSLYQNILKLPGTSITENSGRMSNNDTNIKYILFLRHFSKSARDDLHFGLGIEPFKRYKCPVQNCFTTANTSFMPVEEFDAIIFTGFLARRKTLKFITSQKPHQIYVYKEEESPANAQSVYFSRSNYFNWTMTYRYDSDVFFPYGWFTNFDNSDSDIYKTLTFSDMKAKNYSGPDRSLGKTELVAWFVSRCKAASKREIYVQMLKKYIPIDIYGRCGPLKCKHRQAPECYEMLDRNYKFYLSFENSICKDYVTEKLYNVMELNVIPVVMGGANYSEIVPPHSVINVNDFDSPKDLADYLIMLDKNPELYNSYFWWKAYYKVGMSEWQTLGFCNLCEKLHQNVPTKVYGSIRNWWAEKNVCVANPKVN